ncbi:MAG: hypothetical protein FWB84_06260 [Candidatus Bathyarchaeota archaeon]|uniref:hypothetical protein n=1 Tax=Candidatus Bathycorpusculum sp. TaxID=2994959 RepID=UPI00282E7720|nr:hypothetical protein [Candidatus Termiticorpusculum sp.]MCL2256637.1 hypothetical protein [Candidatus Termiticorpusculum sp.]MCL2293184.1 hypothetical protein [Candidatus Termiticorpusculum sp.]
MKKIKREKNIVFVVLLIIIITISLIGITVFQNLHDTSSNVQLNNTGYLGESKLFLISANTSYGVYSTNTSWTGDTFDNQNCFVITATIRNDYTLEELQTANTYLENTHTGKVYFAVKATLYEGTSQISANDITNAITGSMSPPLGVPQWNLYCNETNTVEIYMATNNRNIDNYTIKLVTLDLSGLPIP